MRSTLMPSMRYNRCCSIYLNVNLFDKYVDMSSRSLRLRYLYGRNEFDENMIFASHIPCTDFHSTFLRSPLFSLSFSPSLVSSGLDIVVYFAPSLYLSHLHCIAFFFCLSVYYSFYSTDSFELLSICICSFHRQHNKWHFFTRYFISFSHSRRQLNLIDFAPSFVCCFKKKTERTHFTQNRCRPQMPVFFILLVCTKEIIVEMHEGERYSCFLHHVQFWTNFKRTCKKYKNNR